MDHWLRKRWVMYFDEYFNVMNSVVHIQFICLEAKQKEEPLSSGIHCKSVVMNSLQIEQLVLIVFWPLSIILILQTEHYVSGAESAPIFR
jgi:hypothetical protein